MGATAAGSSRRGGRTGAPLYVARGVVLRTYRLGEADRILSIMTRERGKIRAVGRGVRRTTSKFGARLEPFMHVDLQILPGRTLDVVVQAQTVDPWGARIAVDYPSYCAAGVVVEATEVLAAEDGHVDVPLYRLTCSALNALALAQRPPGQIADAFLLRGLAVAGLAPEIDACAACGDPSAGWFSAAEGGLLCGPCRTPGARPLVSGTLTVLAGLATGQWSAVDGASVEAGIQASEIVGELSGWHLDRRMRSLRHVER